MACHHLPARAAWLSRANGAQWLRSFLFRQCALVYRAHRQAKSATVLEEGKQESIAVLRVQSWVLACHLTRASAGGCVCNEPALRWCMRHEQATCTKTATFTNPFSRCCRPLVWLTHAWLRDPGLCLPPSPTVLRPMPPARPRRRHPIPPADWLWSVWLAPGTIGKWGGPLLLDVEASLATETQ